ncbi:MAG: extracellular solute-binding protein [Deltaproteobacteria bacterium]|nr:extracellular solute-binding protein [Deltaproteobacteria bacterium]
MFLRRLLIIAVVFNATQSFCQDAKLIDAAKKEGGKVVIYGSLETPVLEGVMQAFRKKTGLQAEYWRASAMSVMNRAMTEYRAGNPLFDVVLNNSDPLVIMAQDGMLAKYDSPTAKKYSADQIDPRFGPVTRYGIVGVVYNKSLVKPEDAPKSIEDLVNPKYKGKLVMADPTLHVTTIQWLSSLHKIMAKEKTEKFIRDLAAMKPVLVESMLPASERVATGEIPIGLTFVKFAYSAAQSGAPLDYVRVDKMLGDSHFVVLSNKAPHSNAGKAFVDFYLDDETMKILAQSGEFVNRKGIYPPLPGADKIQYVQMEVLESKAFEEKKKEFGKIFLK